MKLQCKRPISHLVNNVIIIEQNIFVKSPEVEPPDVAILAAREESVGVTRADQNLVGRGPKVACEHAVAGGLIVVQICHLSKLCGNYVRALEYKEMNQCLTGVEDVAVAGAGNDLPVIGAGQELGRKDVGSVNGLHVFHNAPARVIIEG